MTKHFVNVNEIFRQLVADQVLQKLGHQTKLKHLQESLCLLLAEVFLQRLQILSIPPTVRHLTVQVRAHAVRKAIMNHRETRSRARGLQLECDKSFLTRYKEQIARKRAGGDGVRFALEGPHFVTGGGITGAQPG